MNQITVSFLYILSVLGLVDTLYLSYHAIKKTDVACWWFPKEWCQKVQYSKFSKTFGVPNPYLGLLMYVTILLLNNWTAAGVFNPWILKGVIIFGFIFSAYFTFIQAFVIRAFCTWCVVSALNFTLMFAVVWIK